MKQVFAPYHEWEDWKHGMFRTNDVIDKHKKIIGAIELLTNQEQFKKSCMSVLSEWKVSSDVNMTNTQQNRRAWLGAVACCYTHGTPEFITRIAWSMLNKEDQDKANAVADEVINDYELNKHSYAQEKIRF